MRRRVYIGYDRQEREAFAVAVRSARRRLSDPAVPVMGLYQDGLRTAGVYWREERVREDGVRIDVISDAPVSTEFALTRFLVPYLCGPEDGWVLFTDCDVLFRCDLAELFRRAEADRDHAVLCVKHDYTPRSATKMDGKVQTAYPRKNWSSVALFRVGHKSNKKLTPDLVNKARGLDLHQFCWLDDREIGELPPEYNYLPGYTQGISDPKIVHFTDGGPWHPGFEGVEFADEWREE